MVVGVKLELITSGYKPERVIARLYYYTLTNILLGKNAWDVYPFILLNLFLSMLAAIQAPVIMMSQNRQDAKDRIRSELDYQVNLKAELGVSTLLHQHDIVKEMLIDIDAKLAKMQAGGDPVDAPR